MKCEYCFYAEEMAIRGRTDVGRMELGTVDILIAEALSAVDPQGNIGFIFQGGEPTLAGISFFRYFTDRVRECNTQNIHVTYSIQSNGISLDKEWADFLVEHHFLVGLSMDGGKEIHDRMRPDKSGKSTWKRIKKNLDILKRQGVMINLVCVVSRECARHPQRVYHALKKCGIPYLQFIPCLDPLEDEWGTRLYSLTAESYGDFLCSLFDEWYRDLEAGNYVSVRLFDDYVQLAMGYPADTCATRGNCGGYFVVEADGSLYPCDFYCIDSWKIGELGESPLLEILQGSIAKQFLEEGENRPMECGDCIWKEFCFGGCRRNWYRSSDGAWHNYFCPAFRRFFEYSAERIQKIARKEIKFRLCGKR